MTHDTPPKRIWAGTYDDRSSDNEDEWGLNIPYWRDDARDPHFATEYILATESDAMVAAALRGAADYHDAEIAGLERQIEANNEYLRRRHGEAGAHYLTSEANNTCRSHITHHRLSLDAVLRLIPQPASAALDKLIAEAVKAERERCAKIADDHAERFAEATYKTEDGRLQNAAKVYGADEIAAAIRAAKGDQT